MAAFFSFFFQTAINDFLKTKLEEAETLEEEKDEPWSIELIFCSAAKMPKSSTHLGQPGSAGSRSPSLRKEQQFNRSCMLRIGERLMRAGSESNLVQRPTPVQSQNQTSSSGLGQRSNGRTQTSAHEDKLSKCTRITSSKGRKSSLC